jgi:maltooligosyltrehalose trehalohydrolase
VVLLSPFVPLLFMGEEYGETSPFQYFTSHGDSTLAEAVRTGRREEFSQFGWQGEIPDPQSDATFQNSKLRHPLREAEPHRTLLNFYQELIGLRMQYELGSAWHRETTQSVRPPAVTILRRKPGRNTLAVVFRFGGREQSVALSLPSGRWTVLLNSASPCWLGPGTALPQDIEIGPSPTSLEVAPHSLIVLEDAGSHNE